MEEDDEFKLTSARVLHNFLLLSLQEMWQGKKKNSNFLRNIISKPEEEKWGNDTETHLKSENVKL